MVVRTIRAIAADGQTEICQLNVQDGGAAAEVIIPQDWRTVQELEDISTAITRMVGVLRQYESNPEGGE